MAEDVHAGDPVETAQPYDVLRSPAGDDSEPTDRRGDRGEGLDGTGSRPGVLRSLDDRRECPVEVDGDDSSRRLGEDRRESALAGGGRRLGQRHDADPVRPGPPTAPLRSLPNDHDVRPIKRPRNGRESGLCVMIVCGVGGQAGHSRVTTSVSPLVGRPVNRGRTRWIAGSACASRCALAN
jgi:hypothetical protein